MTVTSALRTLSETERARIESIAAREFPRVRRDGVVFLNSASTGPLPESAIQALSEFNELRAEPWRIGQEEQFSQLDRAREQIARLIGASTDEIALTVNTSVGLNLAARALPLQRGDLVITSDREFPSNIYPWMALDKARGVRFERVPCTERVVDEDAIVAALDRPGVRVLVISWVSFESGVRVDLARLGRECRKRDIFFVVDAIQGVGATPLDVSSLEIDILSCGAQKWLLSPWGTGFTYVRRDLVQTLEPVEVSWMATRASDDFTRMLEYDATWREDARRFELITLPYQDFAGMNASLALFFEVGVDVALARVREHVTRIADWAGAHDDMRLLTPNDPARRAGIAAVIPPDPAAASERLYAAGVAHSLREGALRLSPNWFTPDAHIDIALDLLARWAR
jgi:cysteine desulfurase / selenocysteine lyase